MNIQAKKDDNQFLLENNKYRINAKLILTDEEVSANNIASVVWSFKCTDDHSDALYHSHTSLEGAFLNYGNNTPLIEILAPDNQTHNIKILARVSYAITANVEVITINSNNVTTSTFETVDQRSTEQFESGSIVLSNVPDNWV